MRHLLHNDESQLEAVLQPGGAGDIEMESKNRPHALRGADGAKSAAERARTLQGVTLSPEGPPSEMVDQLARA